MGNCCVKNIVTKSQINDDTYYESIVSIYNKNSKDRTFILNILRSEWQNICNKYCENNLKSTDFKGITFLVNKVDNSKLNEYYTKVITKWNQNMLSEYDLVLVSNHISKCY